MKHAIKLLPPVEEKSWQNPKRGRPYDFEPIGEIITVTDGFECKSCQCSVADVSARSVRERLLLLTCWDCMQTGWVPGTIEMPELTANAVMGSGRFEGLTIAEAYKQPNGEKYLRWLSDHGDPQSGQIKLFFANLATMTST